MTTRRTVKFDFPHSPDSVVQLLVDPEFQEWRGSELGEQKVEVAVQPEGEGHRVVVRKETVADVPAFASKFVSSTNRIEEEVVWKRDGAGWRGDYEIRIDGVPSELRGVTRIAPSTAGCEYSSEVEIRAKVPVVGGKIERLLAEKVGDVMTRAVAKTAERLAVR